MIQLEYGQQAALTESFITTRVAQFERDHADLHKRMDDDQALYELKTYNANDDGTNTFPSYTSNAPRVYAKRVVTMVAGADLFVRIPYGEEDRETRDTYDVKERVFYGFLDAADERLKRRLETRAQAKMAEFGAVRGYICARAILVKDARGGAYVDVTPLDPRTAAWGVGYDGLDWAAYTTSRTAEEINSFYGITVGGPPTGRHTVIDYYDRTHNAVVVKGHGFVKPPQPHGAVGVPIVVVPVGPTTLSKAPGTQNSAEGYGESIFAENRAVYQQRNAILSIYLSLVKKARDRSYILYSPDGGATLQDNPNEAAGVISQPGTNKLELVPLAETTKDSAILAGFVTEEMHFGSLSKTSYGDVPFQLSGFAINSLRQSVFGILQPLLDAVQDAYTLMLNLLGDQYATGAYPTMQLAGFDSNRRYFNAEYKPEVLRGLPSARVKLVAQLPQDDIGQITIAQKAREGAVPLLPDKDILDRIVGVQDVGATQDAIEVQMAKRLSPRAMLQTLMKAAENQGEDELAGVLFGELLVQQLKQMVELASAQIQANMAQQAVGAASGGVDPSVLPNAAQGKQPPQPTPQAGANVPAGTPRPGAQESDLDRLGRGSGQ